MDALCIRSLKKSDRCTEKNNADGGKEISSTLFRKSSAIMHIRGKGITVLLLHLPVKNRKDGE